MSLAENGTAPETVETVIETTPIEQPADVLDAAGIETEKVETPTEEGTGDKPDKADEGKTEDAPTETVEVAPVTFDPADDLPTIKTKADEVLAKYDLSEAPEIQAVIDALRIKAESVPPPMMEQFADYGDEETIKGVLELTNYLYSSEQTEQGTRPHTNKFAEEINRSSPERASWLYFDLAQLPSDKYTGLSKFEEGIADVFGRPGDNPTEVLKRYQQAVTAIQTNSFPASDIPAFIPAEVREAYAQSSRTLRDEIALIDPETDAEFLKDRLADLAVAQRAIDGDRQRAQEREQARIRDTQEFNSQVITTSTAFFDTFRETFAKDVLKDVQFSPDPKMNALLAAQNLTTLTQAFSPDSDGAFARAALAEAGINFDFTKAQKLVSDVNEASVALTRAKRAVDPQGQPLDRVALNKATTAFKNAGTAWQEFAADILQQEKALVSAGTAQSLEKEVKKEVEKQKIAPKGRTEPKGVPTQTPKPIGPPASVRYGTPQWDKWWADQTIKEREAAKTGAYR